MNTDEKIHAASIQHDGSGIFVNNIIVRQSIFFLILKLIIIELIAALSAIIFHIAVISTGPGLINAESGSFIIPLFVFLIVAKLSVMIFVIYRWLEEYYEITPEAIVYKKGFLFKNEVGNSIVHLGSLEVDQNIVGRLFNYGTLKLFNWTTEKDVTLYLIHNPMKYYAILKRLLPDVDREKHVIREHLLDEGA